MIQIKKYLCRSLNCGVSIVLPVLLYSLTYTYIIPTHCQLHSMAVVIQRVAYCCVGVERFCKYTGYADTFQFDGDYADPTAQYVNYTTHRPNLCFVFYVNYMTMFCFLSLSVM